MASVTLGPLPDRVVRALRGEPPVDSQPAQGASIDVVLDAKPIGDCMPSSELNAWVKQAHANMLAQSDCARAVLDHLGLLPYGPRQLPPIVELTNTTASVPPMSGDMAWYPCLVSSPTGRTSQQLPPRTVREWIHEYRDEIAQALARYGRDQDTNPPYQSTPRQTGLGYQALWSAGSEPSRVTAVGGSKCEALGFAGSEPSRYNLRQLCEEIGSAEQVTPSRCPDCNGSGVLAGFGFGTSENAVDRPCPCSPPKDEGPSEWTVVDQRLVDTNHFGEWWNVTVCKGPRKRMYEVIAGSAGTTVSSVGIRKRLGDFDVVIKGEHCVDMAIARLLCGLRDGSIVP